jgi:hypothetical protein
MGVNRQDISLCSPVIQEVPTIAPFVVHPISPRAPVRLPGGGGRPRSCVWGRTRQGGQEAIGACALGPGALESESSPTGFRASGL